MTPPLEPLKQVSVALLSCNRRDELRTTLAQLTRQGSIWHEIIVADNASSDGSVAMVRAEFPEVRVTAREANDGVAGLNHALREAQGTWILTLDDDSAPELETWGPLAQVLAGDPPFAAITCSVRAQPGETRPAREVPVLQPYLGYHQAGGLLRKDAARKLRGFSEELFLWGVELDLAARAAAAGLSFARCASAVVVHRSTPLNRSSRRHAYHYCRNLLLLVLRFAPHEMRARLIEDYLKNVVLFTLLQRTWLYVRATRDAIAMGQRDPKVGAPLTMEQFRALGPDLRAPFAYLG